VLWYRGSDCLSDRPVTLNPILERLFLRDLIWRGEREGRKIEAICDKVQVKLEKKNHSR
jgi:hypothetical protein